MGVDLVCICFTCKTYCIPMRDVFTHELIEQINKGKYLVDFLRDLANDIKHTFSGYKSDSERLAKYCVWLANWLEKHRGHRIWITNDHALGICDDPTEEFTRDFHEEESLWSE